MTQQTQLPHHHHDLVIPEAEHRFPPTSTDELDTAVAALAERKRDWVDLGVNARIALLDRMIEDTAAEAEAWAATAADAKGIAPGTPLRGEEWLAGPAPTLRNLRLLKRTLEDIRDHGEPQFEAHTRPSGQVAVKALPLDLLDRVMFQGFSAEVWMQPHVTLEETRRTAAWRYGPGGGDDGGVCLVLGAGNISAIPPTDALYKLFVEDRVVILKMNPVNEYAGPHVAAALQALVEEGYLRIVYGGVAESQHLIDHAQVDEIHMTGSDGTFDAILFGKGEEQERRKADDDPRMTKPITSELGNVTPIIVVPGPWSDGDVEFQGENLAAMLTHNAGFNCIAGRLIVTHRKWSRRRALLSAVRSSLQATAPRAAYYPGARDRWQEFVDTYPQAEWYGSADQTVPWTFIPEIDPESEDLALQTEVFCGVTGEVPLDAPTSVPDFIADAVRFCNDQVWGSLGATIVVHPKSLRDPAVKAAVEKAIEDLRYGTVMVNHWPGLAFGLMSTSWGAFPGHDRTDIQSGQGVVHNTFMLKEPQKSVVRGPFKPATKPIWFGSHGTLDEIGPRATELEATQDLKVLPGLVWAALRG